MTKWTLSVRKNDYGSVDGSVISRQQFSQCSEAEILGMPIVADGLEIPLRELADLIVESAEDDRIQIDGHLSNVHFLASAHDAGTFTIDSDVGNHVATGMTGGVVEINGNVGDFLSAPRGAQRVGMRGGLVKVTGDAGNYAGHRMRRGTILVDGNVGDYAGASMVAGTLAVAGSIGCDLGIAMKRGTILLRNGADLVQQADKNSVRFSEPARYEPNFLSLYDQGSLSAIMKAYEGQPVFRTRADRSVSGQGEIIFALNVPMA